MKYLENSDYQIISSNLQNEGYSSEWGELIQYYKGDFLTVEEDIYRALENNIGKNPPLFPLYWKYIGKINSRKIQDDFINTQSAGVNPTWYIQASGWADCLILLNTEADGVVIRTNDGFSFFKELVSLDNSTKYGNFGSYVVESLVRKRDFVVPFPLTLNTRFTITLQGQNAKCGVLLVGRLTSIGASNWGAKVGFMDYSKVIVDEEGFTSYAVGNFAKRGNFEVLIATAEMDSVLKRLEKRRGRLTAFIGDDGGTIESSIIYGFVSDFSPVLENPTTSTYNIEIKGVI